MAYTKHIATRLIIVLALIISVAQGQYTKHLIPTTSIDIAMGAHVPAANPNGKKHAVIIYLHGIDLRGPQGDITTANGVDKVANKGVPSYIVSSPMPYFTKPGTTTQYRYSVFFPQCPNTYGVWHDFMIIGVINYVKNNYSHLVDVDRIMLIGFSLGGGGVFTALDNPNIRNEISMAVAIAPGYQNSVNYDAQADENPPLFIYHHVNDALATIVRSDNTAAALNSRNSVNPVQFIRILQDIGGVNNHDIWPQVEVQSPTGSYALTNGDTWVVKETIYQTGLRYTKNRYRRTAHLNLKAQEIFANEYHQNDGPQGNLTVSNGRVFAMLPINERKNKNKIAA